MARSVVLTSLIAAVALGTSASGQVRRTHPVLSNIGGLCRWQNDCMFKQQRSMRSALEFVGSNRPPTWRVELCNRNASRARNKVDWIGFDSCIRNKRLKKPRR